MRRRAHDEGWDSITESDQRVTAEYMRSIGAAFDDLEPEEEDE